MTILAAAIVAMGLGVPAASASVAGGYVVATGTTTIPANNQGGLTVACPANHKVLSGGLENPGGTDQDINSSYPTTSPVGWHVDLNNREPSGTLVEVFAVCVKTAKSYTVVAGTPVSNPSGAYTTSGALCPTGTVVMGGGGFSSLGQDTTNTVNSAPSGKTAWEFSEFNESPFSGAITPYAVCAKKVKNYKIVTSGSSVSPGAQLFLPVDCPFLTAPLGGGVAAGFAGDEGLAGSYPDQYNWDGAFNNRTSSILGVNVYAICAQAGS